MYAYLSNEVQNPGPSNSTGTGLNRDLGDSTLQRKKFDVSVTVIKKNRFRVDINKLVTHMKGGFKKKLNLINLKGFNTVIIFYR